MTQEEEIVMLRAQVAAMQRAVEAQADALRAAARRLEVEGEALRVLSERKEAARLKKARQRALRGYGVGDGVSRDYVPAMSPGQMRDNAGTTPHPPPLDGSPPPSIPSSPSPLSSPPSFLPPSSAPEYFRLEPRPTRRAKKPKPEKPTDPRHAPLVAELVAVCQEATGRPYRFNRGHDARAVADLLASADQDATTCGEAAHAEVVRRWRIGLAWRWGNGEAPVQDLPSLNRRWQNCASTETAPPAGRGANREDPNAGILQAGPSVCAGCEAEGETANVGEPETMLGYACGCLAAWTETGLRFPQAQDWAERRKRGH